MKRIVCLAVAGLFLAGAQASFANVIASENFDGGAKNLIGTANVFDFGAGGGSGGDVFGRVSPWNGGTGTGAPFDVADDSVIDWSGTGSPFPGDNRGIAGQFTTAFFAMNDMDGTGINPVLPDATWTFDISSATSLTNIRMDIAGLGDFEASTSDGFLVEARVDANPYVPIFAGITDEAAAKTYRRMDDGTVPIDTNDPLELYIDGTATGIFLDKAVRATGKFDRFTSVALAGQAGSTLDIRVSWAGSPSGSEPMGLDNFLVNGVPEPTTLGLLMVGAVLGLRRRR